MAPVPCSSGGWAGDRRRPRGRSLLPLPNTPAHRCASPLHTPNDTQGAAPEQADADYWKVTLSAGQRLVVWVDSLVTNATYTVRLFAPAPDSLQRLCYGGDVTSEPGTEEPTTTESGAAPVTSEPEALAPAGNQDTNGEPRAEEGQLQSPALHGGAETGSSQPEMISAAEDTPNDAAVVDPLRAEEIQQRESAQVVAHAPSPFRDSNTRSSSSSPTLRPFQSIMAWKLIRFFQYSLP